MKYFFSMNPVCGVSAKFVVGLEVTVVTTGKGDSTVWVTPADVLATKLASPW